MPKLDISPYPDTPTARSELVEFLNRQLPPQNGHGWEQRLRYWWDENPAAAISSERGRWVHSEGRLVAYGGSIPALHTWQERICQTVYATTFCMDGQFPKAAALIFLQQREVAEQFMIIHSTPSPRIQEALFKMGARAEQTVTRRFFPAGLASRVYGRSWWPSLPADKRVVTDPTQVTAIAHPTSAQIALRSGSPPNTCGGFAAPPRASIISSASSMLRACSAPTSSSPLASCAACAAGMCWKLSPPQKTDLSSTP